MATAQEVKVRGRYRVDYHETLVWIDILTTFDSFIECSLERPMQGEQSEHLVRRTTLERLTAGVTLSIKDGLQEGDRLDIEVAEAEDRQGTDEYLSFRLVEGELVEDQQDILASDRRGNMTIQIALELDNNLTIAFP